MSETIYPKTLNLPNGYERVSLRGILPFREFEGEIITGFAFDRGDGRTERIILTQKEINDLIETYTFYESDLRQRSHSEMSSGSDSTSKSEDEEFPSIITGR